MVEITFFEQAVLVLLGIIGVISSVILAWYLRKRETCNRIKEEQNKELVATVQRIEINLDSHIKYSKEQIKRINRLEEK